MLQSDMLSPFRPSVAAISHFDVLGYNPGNLKIYLKHLKLL